MKREGGREGGREIRREGEREGGGKKATNSDSLGSKEEPKCNPGNKIQGEQAHETTLTIISPQKWSKIPIHTHCSSAITRETGLAMHFSSKARA